MTRGGRDHDLLAKLTSDFIDGNERMRALVNIGSNDNHEAASFTSEVMVGPVGGHISVGAMPRSYQVTPAGPSHLVTTKPMNANPGGGKQAKSQTPGDQDPTTATAATSP